MLVTRSLVRSSLWLLMGLLLAAAPVHAAEGMTLAWRGCLSDGGISNLNFACNTNSGSQMMFGTFESAQPLTGIVGLEIVVELASASADLPPWWTFHNSGTCRPNSLSASAVDSGLNIHCTDWSEGVGFAALASYCTSAAECVDHPTATNVARIKVVSVVPQDNAVNLSADQEYFAFILEVNRSKSVGPLACAGCTTPACIVLNSIDIVSKNDIGSRKLTTAASPGSNYVTWQGGGLPVVGGVTGCPATTATRGTTWGAVKSLYR